MYPVAEDPGAGHVAGVVSRRPPARIRDGAPAGQARGTDAQHRRSGWHRHRPLAAVPRRLLRADRLECGRFDAARECPGIGQLERLDRFDGAAGASQSRSSPRSTRRRTRGTRPTGDGSPMFRRKRAGPEVLVHTVSGPPRRLPCPARAARSPCGDATGRCFTSSTSRVGCGPWRCAGRERRPVFGLPTQARPAARRLRALGHAVRRFAGRQPHLFHAAHEAPSPREIQVAINWRALLD